MSYGSIYKIVFPNGKHYIGLTTTSLEQRTKEHKCLAKNGDTKCLYNAIRKYDMVDTFELIEIDTADTLEELCEKEIGYIIEYNSYYMNGNGYNMTYGGEGTNGYVYTDQVKQIMSEMCKKYWENPEARKKQSEKKKTYFENNPEAREQMSEIKKKYYEENPEVIQRISEKSTKQWKNSEAREQMSEIKKKYYEENQEAREQMSEIKKKYYEENPEAGKEHSEKMKKYYEENPEAREQMSEIKKKYFENPEAIKKCSKAQKKRFENPEEIKKNSERLKKYYEENPEAKQQNSERLKKYYEENPEAKQQNSERLKKYYEEHPEIKTQRLDAMGKNKPFDVFKIDGTFIKTFTYIFEAKEYLQNEYNITSIISIGSVLEGKRNSSAGFVFKYK
jgi:hypothetical protein